MRPPTAGDPSAVAGRGRAELRALDPELPVVGIHTSEQHLDDVVGLDWLVAVLLSTLSGVALTIACLGLFSALRAASVDAVDSE